MNHDLSMLCFLSLTFVGFRKLVFILLAIAKFNATEKNIQTFCLYITTKL